MECIWQKYPVVEHKGDRTYAGACHTVVSLRICVIYCRRPASGVAWACTILFGATACPGLSGYVCVDMSTISYLQPRLFMLVNGNLDD